jgi:1-acyl-sn-glycerol-3-phosphate acyltransferase
MRCININKIYDENDINKLNDYVDSDEKFIVIFNHTNLVEPFLLYSVYPKFSIVLNHTIPSTIPFFNIIKEKLNYIYTEKDKTTENIIEYTKNRKKGDSVLMIAPSGGKVSDDPNNRITKFRSGAFVGKFPILPIVIKFDNNIIDYNHDKGESFIQAVLKIFLHQKYNVKIKVLDMMYPLENEEINDYKDRAHQLMSKEYATL